MASSDVPPCHNLGAHCRGIQVILRVGSLEDGETSLDHEATWLLGHTDQITFGPLWDDEGDLYVNATLHVPCRHLQLDPDGTARCRAHGFLGRAPRGPRRHAQPRRLGGNRFQVVDGMRAAVRALHFPAASSGPSRSLPILADGGNPCAQAPCRTADNRQRAACCRDLQVEIMCTKRQQRLEALVRSRKSPYLCKVERGGDFSIEAEMISACGYLADDGVGCSLHGRQRADGRPAKPDLCTEWPPKRQDLHPGCVFAPGARRRKVAPV